MGTVRKETGETPIPDATWYVFEKSGDGWLIKIPKGALAGMKYIAADMLLDGNTMSTFRIDLQAGNDGPAFGFRFGCLNQCGLRIRMPMSLTDLNRWGIEREGAFLKPRCHGDRIDLENVDRVRFFINRTAPGPTRFCITTLIATKDEVPKITKPILPKGPLLDELGQSTIHEWRGKTKNLEAVKSRITSQFNQASEIQWPDQYSRWGGWKGRRFENETGFFRTHHDGERWWLMDPDGFAYWSAGLDCVRMDIYTNCEQLETALTWLPQKTGTCADMFTERNDQQQINYLAGNFIRTFNPKTWRDKWTEVALSQMKRIGFNTVANWSKWECAAKAQFPYVRPMSFNPQTAKTIYRDFPDVYHPDFDKDAIEYAAELKDTVDDPAFIGYFMMNEPQWGFSKELPAVGMLYSTPECETRKELANFLKIKYQSSDALSTAWNISTTFDAIESGTWKNAFTESATNDLRDFSEIMVEKYFTTLAKQCRTVDPNHLNLGIRYQGVPPKWTIPGMKSFDVFSMNCYKEKVPTECTEQINKMLNLPTVIGEWHFGALDAGLPSSGIGHLKNQSDRAKAYRIYFENAAANPNCIGVHWFTMYDESALGRFDGENYNIGFFDVCNRPYPELCEGAMASHLRMYELAVKRLKPFDDEPEYLPNVH